MVGNVYHSSTDPVLDMTNWDTLRLNSYVRHWRAVIVKNAKNVSNDCIADVCRKAVSLIEKTAKMEMLVLPTSVVFHDLHWSPLGANEWGTQIGDSLSLFRLRSSLRPQNYDAFITSANQQVVDEFVHEFFNASVFAAFDGLALVSALTDRVIPSNGQMFFDLGLVDKVAVQLTDLFTTTETLLRNPGDDRVARLYANRVPDIVGDPQLLPSAVLAACHNAVLSS